MPILQPRQSRNAESALGDPPVQATVYGVWLTGIAIGVILMIFLAGFNIFGGDKPIPGAQASAYNNSVNQIPDDKQLQIVKEGAAIFNTQCGACHQQGGYAATGPGPRLSTNGKAFDISYVQHLVRWGYNPMPAFSKAQLPDQDLFKITTYLQFIHLNPADAVPK